MNQIPNLIEFRHKLYNSQKERFNLIKNLEKKKVGKSQIRFNYLSQVFLYYMQEYTCRNR